TRVVIVFLGDILEFHHNVLCHDPSSRECKSVDRDLRVRTVLRFDRYQVCSTRWRPFGLECIVATADPELILIAEAIEELAGQLRGIASRRFKDFTTIRTFIGSKKFEAHELDKRIDHKGTHR